MKKSTNVIGVCLVLILLFSVINNGCADSNSKIIGVWIIYKSEINGKQELHNSPKRRPFEFFADKTVSQAELGIGNWVFLNDGRIKMTWHNTYMMFANLEGDNLIITVPGENSRMFFKKVNK